MKWMPKWIGKRYAKLWAKFKEELFTYNEARNLLKKYTSNYLSEFKKCQALVVFEKKGRKRTYRLLSPKNYVYNYAYKVQLESLKQGPYFHLLAKIFFILKENLSDDLLSVGLFGSVAKGTAQKDSDLDLFIIMKNLNLSFVERIEYFLRLKQNSSIREEIAFLRSYGYNPKINFIIKEKSELSSSFFTIDITFDMLILYDVGVLKHFLQKNKEKIEQEGIEKKYFKNQKYYLDLNIDFGEVYKF